MILYYVGLVLAPLVIHELAHYLIGRITGYTIVFKFAWGTFNIGGHSIHIPRYTWDWPSGATENQLLLICQAGFCYELAISYFLSPISWAVAVIHFCFYPWYAGAISDFNGMIKQ